MAAKFYLILVLLAISYASGLETVNGKIKILTVTTSACGDTVNFINNQLVPAYEQYGQFLDLEFVPWGRTQNHGDGNFTCQFGVNDCWANRLHRCVLNLLQGNQKAQLQYMACELSPPYPGFSLGSYDCVQAVGVDIASADYCVSHPELDTLDAKAEQAAAAPMSIIDFVPSIVFNDKIDVEAHEQARNRLSSMICFALADDPTSGIVSCQI